MQDETKTEAELEQEGTENQEETQDTQNDDPLDTLTPEEILAAAKKYRAMAHRKNSKGDTKVETRVETKEPYMTRKDFEKAREAEAREMLLDKYPDLPFDKVLDFYSPRKGKETAKQILADLEDAVTLYEKHNPTKQASVETALKETRVDSPSGSLSKEPPKEGFKILKDSEDNLAKKYYGKK